MLLLLLLTGAYDQYLYCQLLKLINGILKLKRINHMDSFKYLNKMKAQ